MKKIERRIRGAVRDFCSVHPDAMTPRGKELIGSLAKRIIGELSVAEIDLRFERIDILMAECERLMEGLLE